MGAGVDVWAPALDHGTLLHACSSSYTLIDAEDMEAWRIAAGIPRFGVDGRTEDLPDEAGFAAAVSYDKGCFLGQEAVAKVRNLGHPRRLVVHLAADDPVSNGDVVEVEGEPVGEITSASELNRGWWILARINWTTREGPFRTKGGVRLTPVPHRS
jgi:folate-binding protein YgfZ